MVRIEINLAGLIKAVARILPLAASMIILLTGCGYSPYNPTLPQGGEKLALGKIENLTLNGELDVRLRRALMTRLHRNPNLRMVAPESSEQILGIKLTRLDVSRTVQTANTDFKVITYSLNGSLWLQRSHDGGHLLKNVGISVNSQVVFPVATLETPAVRDEGLEKVVNAFAKAVETKLFQGF